MFRIQCICSESLAPKGVNDEQRGEERNKRKCTGISQDLSLLLRQEGLANLVLEGQPGVVTHGVVAAIVDNSKAIFHSAQLHSRDLPVE